MITGILLQVAIAPIWALWYLLPTANEAFGATMNAITSPMASAYGFSWLVPIGTIFAVGIFVLAFEVVMAIWYGFNWFLKKLPGWISG